MKLEVIKRPISIFFFELFNLFVRQNWTRIFLLLLFKFNLFHQYFSKDFTKIWLLFTKNFNEIYSDSSKIHLVKKNYNF